MTTAELAQKAGMTVADYEAKLAANKALILSQLQAKNPGWVIVKPGKKVK